MGEFITQTFWVEMDADSALSGRPAIDFDTPAMMEKDLFDNEQDGFAQGFEYWDDSFA